MKPFTSSIQISDSASDRVVNPNRVFGGPQKGIRVMECVDTSATAPYGFALGGTGSPNTIGNVVVYTQRVVNRINALIGSGAPRTVQYSPMTTYDSRAKDWLPKTVIGDPSLTSVQDFIISKALLFYVGMEGGHSINLNLSASSNPHFPSGSGDTSSRSRMRRRRGSRSRWIRRRRASTRSTFRPPTGRPTNRSC